MRREVGQEEEAQKRRMKASWNYSTVLSMIIKFEEYSALTNPFIPTVV